MVPESKDVTITVYDNIPDEVVVPDQPERTEKVGDNWGWAAFILPLAVGSMLWMIYTFWIGVAGAIGAFVLMMFVLHFAGSTWFPEDKVIPATTKRVSTIRSIPRKVSQNKQVAEHRCCVQCKHPIKILR
jgi:hypothetical protein